MPAKDPAHRAMIARIAIATRWSRERDRAAATAAARAALTDRFAREVDPDGTLPPEERARLADHARRAHMQRMSLRSAQARRARRDGA